MCQLSAIPTLSTLRVLSPPHFFILSLTPMGEIMSRQFDTLFISHGQILVCLNFYLVGDYQVNKGIT